MPNPGGSGKASHTGPSGPVTPGGVREQGSVKLPTHPKSYADAAVSLSGLPHSAPVAKRTMSGQRSEGSTVDGSLSAKAKPGDNSEGLDSHITASNGTQIPGILHAYNQAGDIVIQEQVQGPSHPPQLVVVEKKDIVALTVSDVNLRSPSSRSLSEVSSVTSKGSDRMYTDSELAAARQTARSSDQRSAPLIPFEFHTTDSFADDGLSSSKDMNSWTAEQMFRHNDKHFRKTDFDPDMPQYTTQLIKENTPEYRQKEAEATRIANLIMKKKGYATGATGYSSDGEEGQEDEEGKFSAVTGGPQDNRFVERSSNVPAGNWRSSQTRVESTSYTGGDNRRSSGPSSQSSVTFQQQQHRNSPRGGRDVAVSASPSQDVRGSSSRDIPGADWQHQTKQRSLDRASPVSVTAAMPSTGQQTGPNRSQPIQNSPPGAVGKPSPPGPSVSVASQPPTNVQSFRAAGANPKKSGPDSTHSQKPDFGRGGSAKPPYTKSNDRQPPYQEFKRSSSDRSSGKENQSAGNSDRPSPDIADSTTPVQPHSSPPARLESVTPRPQVNNAWVKPPHVVSDNGSQQQSAMKFDSQNHPTLTFTNQNIQNQNSRMNYPAQEGGQRLSRNNSSEYHRHSGPGNQQQRERAQFQQRNEGSGPTFRTNRSKEGSPTADSEGRSFKASPRPQTSPRPRSVDAAAESSEDRTDNGTKPKWNINAKEFVMPSLPTKVADIRVSPHRDDSGHSQTSVSPVLEPIVDAYRGQNIQRQHSGSSNPQQQQQHPMHHHPQHPQQQHIQHHQQQQQMHHHHPQQQQQQQQPNPVSPSAGILYPRPEFPTYPQGYLLPGYANAFVPMYNPQQQSQPQQSFSPVIMPNRPGNAQIPFTSSPQMYLPSQGGPPPPQMMYAQPPPHAYMPNGMPAQPGDPAMYAAQMPPFIMQQMTPTGQILYSGQPPGGPYQAVASPPGFMYMPSGQYPMGQPMPSMMGMPYGVPPINLQQQQQTANQAGFIQAQAHYRPPGQQGG